MLAKQIVGVVSQACTFSLEWTLVMITPAVHLAVLCLCSGLLTSQAAPSADWSRWGKVRPARVLEINDTINVHVVPHTHDDVGWLKTVDEYYYGGRCSLSNTRSSNSALAYIFCMPQINTIFFTKELCILIFTLLIQDFK